MGYEGSFPTDREGKKEAYSLWEKQPMSWKDDRERDSKGLRCCLDPEKGGRCGKGSSSYSKNQNPRWPGQEAES